MLQQVKRDRQLERYCDEEYCQKIIKEIDLLDQSKYKLRIADLHSKSLKFVPQFNYFTKQVEYGQYERSILLNWFENTSLQKKLRFEVVIRATQLLDLYLSKVPNALENRCFSISQYPKIYTLGGMCLDLAQKMVQQVPNVFSMLLLTFNVSERTLLQAELEILKVFNYNVNFITYVQVINMILDVLFSSSMLNSQLMNSSLTLSGTQSLSMSDREIYSSGIENSQLQMTHRNRQVSLDVVKNEAINAAYSFIQTKTNFIHMNQFDIGVLAISLVLKRYGRNDKLQQLASILRQEIQTFDISTIIAMQGQVIIEMGEDFAQEWFSSRNQYEIVVDQTNR